MKMIPSFYHPSRIMIVDDCTDFLQCISLGLNTNTSTYEYYSNPLDALEHINKSHRFNQLDSIVQKVDDQGHEHKCIDINICDLHRLVYNHERFQRISTVVVDYHMPKINGLEFCERITDPNIQKILLTGTAEEQQAINAFNDGIINQFIQKQSNDLISQVNNAIAKAQLDYFCKISSIVNKAVASSPDETAMLDGSFKKYFSHIVEKYQSVEWYLTESMGSFLLLNEKGEHFGLFTNVKEQLEDVTDCMQAENASSKVLHELKQGNKMLCYHNRESHTFPDGSLWEPYIYATEKIDGQQPYFCAHGPDMFDIDADKIATFDSFRAQKEQLRVGH